MIGTLEAFQAIWVKTESAGNGQTVELVIPALPSSLDTSWVLPVNGEPPTAQLAWHERVLHWLIPSAHAEEGSGDVHDRAWYARLIVEEPAKGFRDRNNVLGLLADSEVGYDAHDLTEMPPFGREYLTIVFPHPNWGGQSGDYASDYRPIGLGVEDRQWPFRIKTDDYGIEVRLRWEGPQDVLGQYELVDERSGEVYPAGDPQLLGEGITLYMYEATRDFVFRYAVVE